MGVSRRERLFFKTPEKQDGIVLKKTISVFFFAVSPTFITRPFNKTVIEGAVVTLLCEATGNPTPKITWMKDGKTVATGDTLTFETNRTHSGKYWCLAENGIKPTVNASANIDVQCKYCLYSWMETCSDWTCSPPNSNFNGFGSLRWPEHISTFSNIQHICETEVFRNKYSKNTDTSGVPNRAKHLEILELCNNTKFGRSVSY